MPKRGRPSREQGRLVLNLLRDGRTAPDGWLPDERAAVTEFHLWAFGAPPRTGTRPSLADAALRRVPEPIRAGDPVGPLPSEVLESVDGGRGIAGFVITPADLDRLAVLNSAPPGRVVEHLDRVARREHSPGYRDEDRFAEGLLDDLRRLGDEYGPLGVAIAAATLTDPRVLVAQIDPDRAEPDRPTVVEPGHYCPTCHQRTAIDLGTAGGNGEPLDAQIARLAGWIVENVPGEPSRSEGAVDCAIRVLGNLLDERDAALGEVARLERLGEERQVDHGAAQATVDRLREFVANLAAEDWTEYGGVLPWVLARPAKIAASIEEQVLGERVTDREPVPPAPSTVVNVTNTGHDRYELSVAGPGTVTCDGRMLRVEYDGGGYDVTAGTPAEVTPDPTDEEVADAREYLGIEDPRTPQQAAREERLSTSNPDRPIPGANAWPDDAVLLTYTELRRLVALHLDTCRQTMPRERPWDWIATRARAVRDGEVPLLIAEVLQS